MSLLRPIWEDLKARKLLPVAGVLLLAIVAVPIVLSSSPAAPPPAPTPVAAAPAAPGLPAVNETSTPSSAAPTGPVHNPFAPSSAAGSVATSTTATGTTAPVSGAGSGAPSAATNPGSASAGSAGSTPPSTSPTGAPPSSVPTRIPVPKPKRTTPALSPEQSYAVSLAITNSSGGIDTIDPLERLSPLPSANLPLLVELGVLKGGSRVLFAVQPGTVVSGPGSCIPGPIDCEILSMAQSQTERLSVRSPRGAVALALFAVTGIRAAGHSSQSAALKTRARESSAGRRVLDHSSLNALSLFRYEPSLGAVVDLRNLTLRNS